MIKRYKPQTLTNYSFVLSNEMEKHSKQENFDTRPHTLSRQFDFHIQEDHSQLNDMKTKGLN